MASSAAQTPAALQYNNIVFHHVPNAQAPGLLAAMLVFAFCLGAITLEIVGNGLYDFQLIRKSGWREPVKAVNRLAYFACRYGAFVFFLITIIYINLPETHCSAYAYAVNVMWVFPIVFVDLIFVQRTFAVYSYNKFVVAPLMTIYIAYVGICAYSVIKFGEGYQIPGTKFCAYQTLPTNVQPHGALFITYISLVIVLDSLILTLTTHRLIEGGLGNSFRLIRTKSAVLRRNKAAMKAAGHEVGEVSLSGLLIRQGVGYFLVLEASRLAFLVVYYTLSSSTSYQVLMSGILVVVGPLMAGMLFRQTAEAVERTALQSSSGGQNMGMDSHIRSFRSSVGPTPTSVTPFTPVSRDQQQLNALHSAVFSTPLSPTKRESFEDGYYQMPSNGFHRGSANEKGLHIYVDEKSDVEKQQQGQHHIPVSSRSNSRSNSIHGSVHRLPISQRYMRTEAQRNADFVNAAPAPSSNASHTAHQAIVEDETAFTPVNVPSEAYGSAQ